MPVIRSMYVNEKDRNGVKPNPIILQQRFETRDLDLSPFLVGLYPCEGVKVPGSCEVHLFRERST